MRPRHTPRLCIGLPVYNGENFLAQAIESLLGQTFTDFRLIVSDNASTDGTADICRSYGGRDDRIDYHRAAENRGLAWNHNRVVALADAELFKWAAHDDLYAPRFVERCIATLERTPRAVLAYPTSYVIDEHDEILSAYRDSADATSPEPYARFASVLWHADGCHMAFGVMRRAALCQTARMGAYPASDTVLLAELALRGELHRIDEPLFFWREHAQRVTSVATTDAELAAVYAPENAGRLQLRHLTLFRHYFGAIARAPISRGQKLRCVAEMTRWFAAKFPTIQDEVRGGIAGPVRRALGWTAPARPPGSDARAA